MWVEMEAGLIWPASSKHNPSSQRVVCCACAHGAGGGMKNLSYSLLCVCSACAYAAVRRNTALTRVHRSNRQYVFLTRVGGCQWFSPQSCAFDELAGIGVARLGWGCNLQSLRAAVWTFEWFFWFACNGEISRFRQMISRFRQMTIVWTCETIFNFLAKVVVGFKSLLAYP